jgi:hypothetical protein
MNVVSSKEVMRDNRLKIYEVTISRISREGWNIKNGFNKKIALDGSVCHALKHATATPYKRY